MDAFAFIIHPIDPKRDIARKFPLLARIVNEWVIYQVAPHFPPVLLSRVEGVRSASSGKQVTGYLIACPLTPKHFRQLPEKQVYRKIIETGRLAERLGAKILGLGAYTSVVGDGGVSVADALGIPVTTGDAYTVAGSVRAIQQAAALMGLALERSRAAVVGATGTIGSACAGMLARQAAELTLVARSQEALDRLRDGLMREAGTRARIVASTDMDVLSQAQFIITATSSMQPVIHAHHLRPGAIVYDIARPRDTSIQVRDERKDVLVIDGGVIEVPGEVDFHFNFGLPSGRAYACMAETMALALEGRFEDFTLGKTISPERIAEITRIADAHGFNLAGYTSFDQPVTDGQLDFIRLNARKHSQVVGG